MRQVRTHDARWRAIDASTYSLCKWDWPDLCGTCEGGHGLLLCSVVGCINMLTRDSQSYLRLTVPKHAHAHTRGGHGPSLVGRHLRSSLSVKWRDVDIPLLRTGAGIKILEETGAFRRIAQHRVRCRGPSAESQVLPPAAIPTTRPPVSGTGDRIRLVLPGIQ